MIFYQRHFFEMAEALTMRFLRQLRSLKPVGRRVFLQAAILLPFTALGLRLFGLMNVYAGLGRLAGHPGQAPPADEVARVRRARRVIRYLGQNGPYRGNCLSRSLILWWLLRRQGIESDLRIGVQNEAGRFQAHAWVEYQGRPLNASQQVHQRYVAFEQAIVPRGVKFS